ncbi:Vitamin B12 import system permease protein BtuC [Streptomyces californicus]
MVGAALALAGTALQGITRNPIADPGILGISQGASVAVVVAIAFAGVHTLTGYVWFAFGGAALASVAVYAIAARGRGGLPRRSSRSAARRSTRYWCRSRWAC